MSWEPTADAGAARLNDFAVRAGADYARLRNFDLGPDDRSNVSTLSPWIRRRLVTEEQTIRAVLALHDAARAEKFIQEVFWRGYFKGWLESRPSVWRAYQHGLMRDRRTLERDPSLRARYEEAIAARVGIDCFDAWVRELVETGYLHNHARMWFASIWTHTLALPWRLGADLFLRHLLDGDPASNTLSWRWVVGLHTVGKVYQARASNIAKFTNGRFHPGHALAHQAPILDDDPVPPPEALGPSDPHPAGGRVGVVVTDEDCAPETMAPGLDIVAAIAVVGMAGLSPDPVGGPARAFAEGAASNALARIAASGASSAGVASDPEDWGALLADWAAAARLDAVVAAAPPVGPVADRLGRTRRALAAAGVALHLIRRPYDEAVWPHAAKGFFALKKKIPKLLDRLALH